MLDMKITQEVIDFVEHKKTKGASIQEALSEISKREEARGGHLKEVLSYIGNNAMRYEQLKNDLRQETELDAQDTFLDTEAVKQVVSCVETYKDFHTALVMLSLCPDKDIQKVLTFIDSNENTYMDLKNDLHIELCLESQKNK